MFLLACYTWYLRCGKRLQLHTSKLRARLSSILTISHIENEQAARLVRRQQKLVVVRYAQACNGCADASVLAKERGIAYEAIVSGGV